MGFFGGFFRLIGFLVLVVVGLGAYLYFVDYTVEATITEKGKDASGDYIIVTPARVPYDVRQELDSEAAQFVCTGYTVDYRINSGHTAVYDREGRLVWDSENGLNDALRTLLTRC